MKWHKWNQIQICIILNFTEFVFAVLWFFYRSGCRLPLRYFAAVREKWRLSYFLHYLYTGEYNTQKCNLKSGRRNSWLIIHPSSSVCRVPQLQIWILPSVTRILADFLHTLNRQRPDSNRKNISSMPFFHCTPWSTLGKQKMWLYSPIIQQDFMICNFLLCFQVTPLHKYRNIHKEELCDTLCGRGCSMRARLHVTSLYLQFFFFFF